MTKGIWAEIYRPHSLKEVVNQVHVVERLKSFVKEGEIPHMIFAGPAGTGKTTCAIATAMDLFGENWKEYFQETNASDERGIDTIRMRIKEYARTKPIGTKFKIVFLDESDALTKDAQNSLRRIMEKYTNVTRFIFSCNYSSRLIPPIQSRCSLFRFRLLSKNDMSTYLGRIIKSEKLNVSEGALGAIYTICEGDLRKATNVLQACTSFDKKITEELVYDIASRAKPVDVKVMMELALAGNFAAARKKLQDMLLMQGLSGEDVVREMHRQLDDVKADERTKAELVAKVGEYEYRISQGGNDLIQLEALLAQLMLCAKR